LYKVFVLCKVATETITITTANSQQLLLTETVVV